MIFRGFLLCLCRIQTISAVCLRSVSQSGQYRAAEIFCIQTILNWADTDLLGSFRGSWEMQTCSIPMQNPSAGAWNSDCHVGHQCFFCSHPFISFLCYTVGSNHHDNQCSPHLSICVNYSGCQCEVQWSCSVPYIDLPVQSTMIWTFFTLIQVCSATYNDFKCIGNKIYCCNQVL